MSTPMRTPSPRIVAFETAVSDALSHLNPGTAREALRRLQRAHVLGQRDFGHHLHVHWLMLRAGWQLRDPDEVMGQLLRLLLVPLGHLTGRLPEGNPGTADVSAFAPHAVASDVADLLARGE